MAKKKTASNINIYLGIALVLVLGVCLYFTLSVPTPSKAAVKPAAPIIARQVEVTVLGSDCTDCVNASVLIDLLSKQAGFNVTRVKTLSINESLDLARKYNVTKLEALLVTGNLSNLTSLALGPAQSQINFEKVDDAFVFTDSPAPYYEVKSGSVRGKVSVILLADTTCAECYNLSPALDQMEKLGLKITSKRIVDSHTDEAKALITKYSIDKVPTLIINSEALEYKIFRDSWSTVGSNESDGKLVLRMVGPPYVNLSTGNVDGLTEITYLGDSSCEGCYNVSVFHPILQQNFNMQFKDEKFIDVNSTRGKLLVKKYNITLVPTVVVSKDAVLYPGFSDVWNKILGTQETDGMFVFRKLPLLENALKQSILYKDLATGQIVNSTQATNAIATNESETSEPDISQPDSTSDS